TAFKKLKKKIPIAISITIEPMGTMLAGQSVESFYASIMHRDLLYIGLNCATGPEFMTSHLRTLHQICHFPIACVPNAGLPDEYGNYLETQEMIAKVVGQFADEGWINFAGGCCGTTPEHIRQLRKMLKTKPPRKKIEKTKISYLSGIDFLEITDEIRPVLVGE